MLRNVTISIVLLFAALAAIAQEPIIITGTVTSQPHGLPPTATVTAFDIHGHNLGETTTSEAGEFSLTIVASGVGNETTFDAAAFPNPFAGSTTLRFVPAATGRYAFTVTSVTGRNLHKSFFDFTAGQPARIAVDGLGSGTYIATVANGNQRQSFTLVGTGSARQAAIRVAVSSSVKAGAAQAEADPTVTLRIEAASHTTVDTTMAWENHDAVGITLQQQPETVTATYTLSVTNSPMNVNVANAYVSVSTDDPNTKFEGQTNENGIFSSEYEQKTWSWPGQADIQLINQINTLIEKEHHTTLNLENNYQEDLSLNSVLEQVSYEDEAQLNLILNSVPLNYAPNNVSVTLKNGENAINSFTLNNGSSVTQIPFVFYVNDSDTLRRVNGENIETMKVQTQQEEHQDAEYNIPFEKNMSLTQNISQNPSVGNTAINLFVANDKFGYPVEGAQIVLKNQNEENLIQGQTNSNGEYQTSLSYNYWSHEDLYLSELEQILLNINQNNHTPYNTSFDNENQNLNITLEQIPETKTANINGYVKQSNQTPIENANIELKNNENTLKTIITNTNGEFQTTLDYNLFINHTNPTQKITEPENIYSTVTKEGYIPTTTSEKNLEELVNFGDIIIDTPVETFTFKIKPYTAINQEMTEVLNEPFTLHIKNKTTGQEQIITQTANQPLQISITGHSYDELQLWNNHLELTDYTVIEHPGQDWREDNVAQNRPIREWKHGDPRDTLSVAISKIANPNYKENLEMYIPLQNYTTNYGNVTFTGDTLMTMLVDRNTNNRIKNWKADHVPQVDRLIWAYDMGTNEPLPQDKLEQMITLAQRVDQATLSASGRIRLPTQYHIINSMDDEIIQQARARDWDYVNMSWRKAGDNTNGIIIDTENWRIKYSSASYTQGAPQGAILEEEFEKTFGTGDAPNNISSDAYITNNDYDNQGIILLSSMGKTMGAVSAMSNPWTEVLPEGTYKNASENE